MLLDWFNAKEASHFGTSLAEFISVKMPPSSSPQSLPPEKQKALLIKVFGQVEQFRKTHKLNIYKKAKLGNAFKWKMLDIGYEKGWTDELTHELMARL